jgi:hypothetical protein
MEQEKKLSEQESLLIIQQMIQTAKQEQKMMVKDGSYGAGCCLAASVLTYINLKTQWFSNYFFWNVFGIASLLLLLFSVVRTFFFKKIDKVKTYTAELFQKLNIGFFISLLAYHCCYQQGRFAGVRFFVAAWLIWFLDLNLWRRIKF